MSTRLSIEEILEHRDTDTSMWAITKDGNIASLAAACAVKLVVILIRV